MNSQTKSSTTRTSVLSQESLRRRGRGLYCYYSISHLFIVYKQFKNSESKKWTGLKFTKKCRRYLYFTIIQYEWKKN